MIIILSEIDCNYSLVPGDQFKLVYSNIFGDEKEIVSYNVIKSTIVKKAIVFLFANTDGNVDYPNISGMFCEELPQELKDAKRLEDLNDIQKMNLLKTSPYGFKA